MSVADIFKSVLPQPAVPAAPTNGVNAPGAGATAANNTTIPPGAGEPAAKTPLADFADIWKTDPNAKPVNTNVLPNLDVKKIQEAAAKLNFTNNIPAELTARVKAGGEDGMAAMMEAVNIAAQNGFTVSTQAATRLIEEGAKAQQKTVAQLVAEEIKKQSVNNALQQENPLLSNPAVAPLVETTRNQFLVKYPNATDAQVKEHITNYLNGLRDVLLEPQKQAEQKTASNARGNVAGTDFSNW